MPFRGIIREKFRSPFVILRKCIPFRGIVLESSDFLRIFREKFPLFSEYLSQVIKKNSIIFSCIYQGPARSWACEVFFDEKYQYPKISRYSPFKVIFALLQVENYCSPTYSTRSDFLDYKFSPRCGNLCPLCGLMLKERTIDIQFLPRF
jgi:hypothetical protein